MKTMNFETQAYALLVKNRSTIVPKVLFEAGAHDGTDGKWLAKKFKIDPDNTYLIEPHPELCRKLNEKYFEFHNINCALSNKRGKLKFRAYKNLECGRSSLLEVENPSPYWKPETKEDYIEYMVDALPMNVLMDSKGLKSIDLFKLDVEGHTYEVLDGFGDRLVDLKSIQLEAEYKPIWKDQKVWSDINEFLEKNNFKCLWTLDQAGIQIDSVWIQKRYIK